MKDPYITAAELGLTIEHTNPGDGIAGLYLGERILLKPGLTSREERSVLAHELGHHYFGHIHVHRSIAPKVENACDVYAAEMLINGDELLRLAKIYPDEPSQIAYELNVSDWVLDAYVRAHPLDEIDLVLAPEELGTDTAGGEFLG